MRFQARGLALRLDRIFVVALGEVDVGERVEVAAGLGAQLERLLRVLQGQVQVARGVAGQPGVLVVVGGIVGLAIRTKA